MNAAALIHEAESFLRFVCDYVICNHTRIQSGQTVAYGYWLTKFILNEDGVLETFEYSPDATSFVRGTALTLTYWRDQHAVCAEVNAAFDPPLPDRNAALSIGVYEGNPVEGVRYPSPEHMSGWWLTTDRYDGDIKSLKVVHLYHVTAARSDLARYLALPAGYRFRQSSYGKSEIWFDETVIKESHNAGIKKA